MRSALLSFCKVFSLSSVCLLLLGISPVMAQDGATECEAENTSDFRRALANSACDVINLTSSDYLITSSAVDYALTINRPVVIQGNGASQTKIQLAWGILVDAPDYPPSPDSIDPEELLCNIGEICTTDFPWMRVEIRDVSIVSALIGPTSVTNDGALLTLERVNISNSIGVTAGALLNVRGNVWLKDSLLKGNSSGIGGAITNAPLAIPDTLGVTDLFNLAVISGAYSADLEDGTLDSSFDLFPGGSLPFMLITNTDIVDNQAESLGGGISNSFGTVLVVNSRISNNKVETLTGALGGGLSNVAGVAIVADSIFQNNIADAGIEFDFSILGGPFSDLPPVEVGAPKFTYASAGGAIYSQTGVLAVQRTDFLGNKASSATFGSRGGAIYAGSALPSPLNDASVSYLDKVTMSDNESGGGGAVHFSKGSHTIKRTFFSGNIASGIGSAKGGAILVENAMLDLQQSTLQRNKAKGNGEGGGIAFVVSTAEGDTRELNVSNSTFSENSAENSGPIFGNGGALYIFSEVNTNDEDVARPTQDIPKVVLEHTTFYANTADRLGSHYFAGSTTALQTIDITVKGSVFTGGNLADEDDDCYLMPGGPLNPDAIDKTEEFSYAATATCGGGGGQFTDGYLLQPLALNGAAVPTHMPSESSSLVDKIQCYSDIDQRGLSRPYQAKSFLDPIDICDPGAVEYADYKLTAFTPAPHANNVAANATIVVTFRDPLSISVALSTDSVSDESLVVDSNLRGRIAGSFRFSDDNRRVSFSPTQPLLAGEQVRVVVTSKIESEKGVPLSNPTQWSFSVGNGAPPHCIAGFDSAGAAFPAVRNATSKLADLDNDGDLDFVLTGSTGTYSRISRVYSNNEGSFDIVGEFDGMQSAALAWGDVNGDGLTDLAATGRTGPKLFQFSTETLFASGILSLQPDGFNAAIAPLPLFDAAAVALGDINTDGLLDLLITGLGESEAAAKRILNRSGRLSATFDLLETAKGLFRGQIILGDLDGDGDLDAVMSGFTTVGSTQVGEIWVLNNNGGEFTQTEKFFAEPDSFAVADVDGDNDLDLLIGRGLYLNRGTGVFNSVTFIDLDVNEYSAFLSNAPILHFVDLNGDEAPDLVVSDRFFLDSVPYSSSSVQPKIRVLINHDGGKFDANSAEFSRTLPIPYVGDGRIEWGDIDGDGDQDALVAGVEQTQIYYQQQCAAVDDLYEVLSVDPQSVGSPDLVIAAGSVLRNDKTLFARSAVLEDDVSFGDLEFRADGSFVYTPLPYFNGTDQFSYRVQSSGILTEPAVISIDVLADRSFACYATSDNGTFVYASNDAAALTLVLANTQPGGTVKVAGDCVGVTPRGEFAETLFIDKDVTILGGFDPDDWTVSMPELFPTLLSADNSGRVVVVTAGSQVVLRDLNLSDGVADNGAGILNEGTLSLATTSVTGNSASDNGGGIYNQGDLTLTASLVALNTAPNGGGIYSNAGSLSVLYSTLSTNQADNGGALWISQPASATFNSTTVAFNEASTEGGGLWLETPETLVNLQNTLLSDNVGSDCGGFFPESNGYNLNADASCGLSGAGDSSVDPLLRSLLANGGATLTHALPVNSPAIDAGNPAVPGTDQAACSALDQRGVPRVEADSCDIGAYEAAVQEQCFAFNATTTAEYNTGGRFLIQTAIDEAAAGDTIQLSGYCTGSATIDKNLHIQGGYDSSNWNIYSPDEFPTTFDALGRRGFLINGVAEVTIEGLTITNSVGAIVSQSSNRNLTVRTCNILDNISPAIEFNGIAFRMEDTEVRRNTYIGDPVEEYLNGVIDLEPRSRTSGMVVSIVNSVIGESIGTPAVRLTAGSSDTKTTLEIIDSSIIDNLGGGVRVRNVMSLSFDNTIVRGNSNSGPRNRGAAVEIEAHRLPFKLNISGGEFSDNSSSGAAAIEIDGWGDVSIVDAHFENNQNIKGRYTEGGAFSWNVGTAWGLEPGTLEPSSLVVRNSRFQGNFGGKSGGALMLLNGPSQPLLDVNIYNSWFEDNGARPTYSPTRVHGGGAIALVPDSREYFERAPINATISGSTFINNTALAGGAIRADRINELIISESTFLNNNAANQSGGALAAEAVERLAISTSSFIGNTAFGNGGAIRAVSPDSTLNAVSILDNAAGAAGGGLVVEASHIDIINSTISGNTACVETPADCIGSYQGFPYGTGGGIAFSGYSTSDIKLSSIVNNQASQFGSGLFTKAGASVGFSNTVMSNNSAEITGGGDLWNVAANGWLYLSSVSSLAIDPSNPKTIYAGTDKGVAKSVNGGTSWISINTGLTNTPPFSNPRVHSLAIDPLTPQTLYAGAANGSEVFKSINGGTSWSAVNTGLTGISHVYSLAIDPVSPQTLYAGTDNGIFRSTDGGINWSAVNTDLTNNFGRVPMVPSLVIDLSTPQTLYAGTSRGVYKSTNGGINWALLDTGPSSVVQSLAIDPSTPQTLYAGTRSSLGSAVFKSTDGGKTWGSINPSLTADNYYSVAIDPSTPQTLYIGTNEGVFRSMDGGTNWSVVNTGLPGTDVYALAIDPLAPRTLYAGADDNVFKSEDAGGNCYEAGPFTLTSNGFNLEDNNECGFDQASDLTNMAALLEPLADNGGLTLTHAPMANSPVINAGDCLADTVKVDQTDKARPVDGACDIGAYEGLSLTDQSTITRLSIAPTPSVVGETVDLRVAVDNTEATPDGLVVFFNDSIELGSAPLDENGEAVLSVDDLAFGPHLLRADYQGTVRFNASSGQISHTVNAAVTELEIYASTPSISQTDDNVTFLFELSVTAPSAGAPDGIISLSENAVELCRVTLPASSCSAVLSTSGFHILEAEYLGSKGFAGATSAPWVQRVIERGTPTPPQVQKIGSSADTSDNVLVQGEQTNAPISKLRVIFSQAMSDPAGDQQRGDVSNTGSYLLVKAVDAATGYQSFSCEEGATLTDTAISIDSVNWISGSATAELSINGGTPLASGNYLLLVCDALNSSLSSKLDGNRDGLPGGNYLHPFEVDLTPPRIVSVVTIPALDDGASLGVGLLDFVPQAFVVEFDELTQDPAGDTLTSDTSNPANYLLFGTGPDSSFETQDCATGIATTDRQITLASTVVSTQSATVILPPAAQFSSGEYRFMVCGTTTIYDIAGNALDGSNNGQGGDDFVVNFAVTLAVTLADTAVPVPTMGRWALAVLTLMTLLLGGAYLRKFARVEAA